MVRKRELTVEKWSRMMEMDLANLRLGVERFGERGVMRFVDAHLLMGHNPDEAYFEMQIAEMWRESGMQVFEFDQDFAESIISEKWAELLPGCIENRPFDSFFMKLPCERLNEGVVVHVVPVENVVNFDEQYFPGAFDGPGVYFGGVPGRETRALVNTGERVYALCSFAISKTLELMFDDTPIKEYPTELVVNGVAYLCSVNADIQASYVPQKGVRKNNAKKRSMATWHDVGYRIGAELRAYERARSEQSGHKGGSVRPHMRRAHWHHYWVGPRDGERKLVLRWIPPVLVASGPSRIKSATGHRVKADSR